MHQRDELSDVVDPSDCEKDPIHLVGRVQSFGCLIAVDRNWVIRHASTNCDQILGKEFANLIGMPLREAMTAQSVHDLRSKTQLLIQGNRAARLFGYDLFENGRRFDISMHHSGDLTVLEIEAKQASPGGRDELSLVQPLIERVRRKKTIEGATHEAARALKALTGLDRVMVYRFEADDSGAVIAEAREAEMPPYLGLRYPASDIPKQARDLYARSPVRLISDVNGATYPVEPQFDAKGAPLDLSQAVTRAVAPVHLEYLRNMEVGASMSLSIVSRGVLWGLMACHHREAFHVDAEKRSAMELFVQLFNYELTQIETDLELAAADVAASIHDRLIERIVDRKDLASALDILSEELSDAVGFDGVVIYVNGTYAGRGEVPTEEEFRRLAAHLGEVHRNGVYATENISAQYPEGLDFLDRAAGMLSLSVSRTKRDYVVFFRKELVRSVLWAGNPSKPASIENGTKRISPRKSFAAWQEVVKSRSGPWSRREIRLSETLRVSLMEIVLKLADEARDARQEAHVHQELLIAELNHRARNILNLIRGLVSQGRGAADTVADYSAVLDARIHSLARAHDQITRTGEDWALLQDLIRNETEAYLRKGSDRVLVSGPGVELAPRAFTTVALVIHELVTNSAKYGALSVETGTVQIDLEFLQDGALQIRWADTGGPQVAPPKRQGFGTTIVERSIPFDLKGKAEVSYPETGFTGVFTLPPVNVRPSTTTHIEASSKEDAQQSDEALLPGMVLVVEDNMIIAMDVADMLTKLGATEVKTVSSVEEAMIALAGSTPSFALLDVNLGEETSHSVAEALRGRKIPFVLASGYGEEATQLDKFDPSSPILQKPFTADRLRRAVLEILNS